ncbi:HNH endonuclease signature motif containing protein [Isoptericola sp. NPDC055881]
MAWLVAHLPAPLAHAAHDRLTRSGRHLVAEGDPRTLAQARADTLAALLLDDGSLDDGALDDGTTGRRADAVKDCDIPTVEPLRDGPSLATLARSIRPRVTVTVPVLSLLGITDAPATMDGHVPIDPDTARQLTALAPSLRRILTDPETGTVLSHGRTTYVVPADLKALVRERDTTCRFPGCTHPAQRADLDHTVAWADGGTTNATNLAALCRRHHVLKHQTTWKVTQIPAPKARRPHPADTRGAAGSDGWAGTLEWVSPTGRRHTTHPPPIDTTRHRSLPHGHEPPGGGNDDPRHEAGLAPRRERAASGKPADIGAALEAPPF